jgi:hypothetical protein
MLEVWPMPEKIATTIKTLELSIKNLEKCRVSDFDIYLGETSTFSLKIDAFLSVFAKNDVTKGINTVEYTQYNLKEATDCKVFLSKELDLLSAEKEMFFPDIAKKNKTLVRFTPEKGGILALFPFFYTIENLAEDVGLLSKSRVFSDKLLEYKAKVRAAQEREREDPELFSYLNDLKFDVDNFIGEDFITVVKSDNNDFVKSKMSVKIDPENYFIITNISYANILKENFDVRTILLADMLLVKKLKKAVDCFTDTFNKDFLISSL